ncbi:MAG: HD domain-containing phosphohydrolase [bacterium]
MRRRLNSKERAGGIRDVRARLAEAEGALEAIRSGRADALVGTGARSGEVLTLRGSDEPYRVFVEAMNEGAVALDQRGTILYCNRRFAEMVNTPIERVRGSAFRKFVDAAEDSNVEGLLERARQGGAMGECTLCTDDGTPVSVYLSARPLYAGGVQGTCLVATDITAHKAAALQQSERRFRALTENSSDAIALVSADGAILYASPSSSRVLGYSSGEIVGRSQFEFVHPDDLERAAGLLRDVVQQPGGRTTAECRMRHKDGSWRWIERVAVNLLAEPSVQAIVTNYRDITDRKLAEVQVTRQVETLSRLSESTQRLSETLNLRQLAEEVVATCVASFAANLAWLGRLEGDGAIRLLACFPSDTSTSYDAAVRWDGARDAKNATALAIGTRAPAILDDLTGTPDLPERWPLNPPPWVSRAVVTAVRSAGAFPLISRTKTFGVLVLYSHQRGFFTAERVEFLQAYARQVAAALENARLFEEADRRVLQLQALRDVDAAIASSLDLRVILDVFLDKVTTQLRVEAGSVLLFNPHTLTFDYAAGRGFRGAALRHSRLRFGQGHAGRAALTGRVVNVAELAKDPGDFGQTPELLAEGFVAYWAVPLIAKGQVKGILEIFRRTPFAPDQEWLDFLATLAGQAAIAIDNVGLFNDLQRSNADLSLAYDTTLEGWSHALDLRDKETEGHTRRVVDMTIRLARAMSVPDADLTSFRRGALLHDIGKMAIPDNILLKPGPLTEDERAIMRRHPQIAYDLLSPIVYLRPVLDIPYFHHEKWDGTGYPRGMKGEQIPLGARIFAVADVWDALRSDRPYRPAWSDAKAKAYILAEAGTFFDPAVVKVFAGLV